MKLKIAIPCLIIWIILWSIGLTLIAVKSPPIGMFSPYGLFLWIGLPFGITGGVLLMMHQDEKENKD